MIDPTLAPIAASAVLQVKHVICDYFLQTTNQIRNKGLYGHPAGLAHAGIHALGSIPVFLIYPTRLPVALLILALEFVAHYHIDWLKNDIGSRFGWEQKDKQYWWAMGLDQLAHLAAGAEGLGTIAAQQHADDRRVLRPGPQVAAQLLDHRQRQGIQACRRIQGGDGQARAVDPGQNFELYSHG